MAEKGLEGLQGKRDVEMKKTIFLVIFILICLAIFVWGVLGIFEAGYTLPNIVMVVGPFIAFITLIITINNSNRNTRNKKEEVFRNLSAEYGKYQKIKDFINDNIDRNGVLRADHITRNQPTQTQVEDFMRFFKNLKWEIECGNISWDTANRKFSKYALLLHRYEFFRSCIADYYSSDWQDFRDFCEQILKMK